MVSCNESKMDAALDAPVTFSVLVYVVIEAVLFVVICLGNGLVMVSVWRFPRLRSVSNLFLVSLAVADFAVGLTMPLHILYYLVPGMLRHRLSCLARYTVIVCSCSASLYSLLLIAGDRYIAIVYPLRYHALVTLRTCQVLVSVTWVVALVSSALPLLGWNTWCQADYCKFELVMPRAYAYGCLLVQFVTMAIGTLTMYSHIFWEAEKQKRRVVLPWVGADGARLRVRAEMQRTRMNALVLAAFLLCWLPFFCLLVLQYETGVHPHSAKDVAASIAVFMGVANSAVNPVIYSTKNHAFRSAYRKLLCLRDDRAGSPSSQHMETFNAARHGAAKVQDKDTYDDCNKKDKSSDKVKDLKSGSDKVKDLKSGSDKVKDLKSGSDKVKDLKSGSDKVKDLNDGSDKVKDLNDGSDKVKDLNDGSDRKDKDPYNDSIKEVKNNTHYSDGLVLEIKKLTKRPSATF